jgi:hypothetical protein
MVVMAFISAMKAKGHEIGKVKIACAGRAKRE